MKSLSTKISITFLVLFFSFTSLKVSGQEKEEGHHHSHDQHKYHVGFGVAGAYLTSEKSLAPGFHLHFLRQIGEEKNWGIGLGYEAIIAENLHSGFNLLANWHPVKFISLNAGPGLTFGKHENTTEVSPAFHTEAVFEFDLNKIHIGPMAGFGIDSEESHFSFGVHLGFGF